MGGDFNADLKRDRKIEQSVKKILNKNNLVAINTIENLSSNIIYRDEEIIDNEKLLKTR